MAADAPTPEPSPWADVPRVVRVAAQVVAPATLVTALLYYFGRRHATYFLAHFGIDISVLDLSTTDFVLRSQDALLVPLLVTALVVLAVVWLGGARRRAVGPRSRWSTRAVVVVGGGLTLFGVVQALRPGLGLAGWVPSWVAPVCLGGGVVVLADGLHGLRAARRAREPDLPPVAVSSRLAEAGAIFAVVAVAAFWATAEYSAAVGESRAQQFEASLGTASGVVVHSTRDLGIVEPGVDAWRCPARTEGDFRFRYDGFVLLTESGGSYVLVPRGWTAAGASVVLVPVGATVRLDEVRSASRDASGPEVAGCVASGGGAASTASG